VELSGARVVRVNGIRMMNPDALPGSVDAPGVVLAASSDRSALLVRPADDQLPDLRVVVTPTTTIINSDSLAADLRELSVGDSVHVHGPTERGFLVSDRITILRASPASTVSSAPREERRDAPVVAPVVRTSAPAVRRERQREERGKGRGKGNKKDKG
jgi:hypothetical protein